MSSVGDLAGFVSVKQDAQTNTETLIVVTWYNTNSKVSVKGFKAKKSENDTDKNSKAGL